MKKEKGRGDRRIRGREDFRERRGEGKNVLITPTTERRRKGGGP